LWGAARCSLVEQHSLTFWPIGISHGVSSDDGSSCGGIVMPAAVGKPRSEPRSRGSSCSYHETNLLYCFRAINLPCRTMYNLHVVQHPVITFTNLKHTTQHPDLERAVDSISVAFVIRLLLCHVSFIQLRTVTTVSRSGQLESRCFLPKLAVVSVWL
jgi:hypothetical protein